MVWIWKQWRYKVFLFCFFKTTWTWDFCLQCLPSTVPSRICLHCYDALRQPQEESIAVGWGSQGWGSSSSKTANLTQSFPCFILRQPEFHSNVHTSRSWTMKSSFFERISLLKVLQELLRPWYKSASSHRPNRPPPPPSSKELMSPLIKYEFSPLHLKTLKFGLKV